MSHNPYISAQNKSQPNFKELEMTKPLLPKEFTPLKRGPRKNFVQENIISSIILCKTK